MGKVVGVGGVFLTAKDPQGLQAWYVEHLGVPLADHGSCVFEGPEAAGQTVLAFFLEKAVQPGEASEQSIVNFRVDALEAVLERVAAGGARVDPKREDYGFGRFGWFWDPEGNRVELWEPEEEAASYPV